MRVPGVGVMLAVVALFLIVLLAGQAPSVGPRTTMVPPFEATPVRSP